MKKKTVTIGHAEYTLNYNVDKDNKCEVVSLTDSNGTDHKEQVDPGELQLEVDIINDELNPKDEGTNEGSGETVPEEGAEDEDE